LGEGFEDVKFAEFALNAERDQALLTVVDEADVARSALLNASQFVIQNGDGFGIQFFGGLDDFDFFSPDSDLDDDFPRYLDAILAADQTGVIDLDD
jgi:hypothetical protein